MWNEAQSRMDAYPSVVGTLGGCGPVGWPQMNLEMHLHLHSELASNEFLTEFALKVRKIPSGFALVRQCREQAAVGRTHASMSVGGHALPLHPLTLKWLQPPPQPTHTTTTTAPPSLQSSQGVQSAALFAGMRIPRSVLLSSVYNVYGHIFFTNNLSLGFLSLLCYIVCVCTLIRPLPLVFLYNFVSTNKELSLVDKHIIHNP